MNDGEDFYQYHNGDDKKLRLFINGHLLWYLLMGEEVAHNLLGGRDPSLVNGLAQYGPPTISIIIGRRDGAQSLRRTRPLVGERLPKSSTALPYSAFRRQYFGVHYSPDITDSCGQNLC